MKKGYVITQIGFDYNDETYYQSESGGGNPIKIYLNKERAEQEAIALNIKELFEGNLEINYLGYSTDEVFDDTETIEKILRKYDSSVSMDDSDLDSFSSTLLSFKDKLSVEDKIAIYNCTSITFYTVDEVQFDDDETVPEPLPVKDEKTVEKKKFSTY